MNGNHTYETETQDRYNWAQTPPSVAIVEAIARIENCPPTELPTTHGIQLYNSINPEALDTLVTSSDPVSLSFTLDEYDVQLTEETLTIRDM